MRTIVKAALSNRITDDSQAWKTFPQHRWLFNKLELSLRLDYLAGPSGVPVPRAGKYVVRPIYNLGGMGLGASVQMLEVDQPIEPGYFWCEYFQGTQYTIDYTWDNGWKLAFAAEGVRRENLTEFLCWRKCKPPLISLPEWFDDLKDVEHINIETIGSRIIEIHLRHGNDFPEGATELIPIWKDMKFEENYEDVDGLLKNPRLGFYYR